MEDEITTLLKTICKRGRGTAHYTIIPKKTTMESYACYSYLHMFNIIQVKIICLYIGSNWQKYKFQIFIKTGVMNFFCMRGLLNLVKVDAVGTLTIIVNTLISVGQNQVFKHIQRQQHNRS